MVRYGYRNIWAKYGCGCPGHARGWDPYRGPSWSGPVTWEDPVDELEDYKRELEAEITALEKRIKKLKEE